MTNDDKMLRMVLSHEDLYSYYNYEPSNYQNIADALKSENAIVNAVAQIILKTSTRSTNNDVYGEIFNYLYRELL